jgi:D-lactate dehydrogenase (cytochrome)
MNAPLPSDMLHAERRLGPPAMLSALSQRFGDRCTGEHGIGLHKMGYLAGEAGAGAVNMMRSLKRALDPKNIMNPGKIFSL